MKSKTALLVAALVCGGCSFAMETAQTTAPAAAQVPPEYLHQPPRLVRDLKGNEQGRVRQQAFHVKADGTGWLDPAEKLDHYADMEIRREGDGVRAWAFVGFLDVHGCIIPDYPTIRLRSLGPDRDFAHYFPVVAWGKPKGK